MTRPTLLPTDRCPLAALLLTALAVGPAPVAVRLDPGPYFVGQAVGVRVEAPATDPGGTPTRVVPPHPAGADLIPVAGLVPTEPRRFWLVPRRAGTLALPPFRAEAGSWGVGSRPLNISVAPLPRAGRPASFGGGVGPFQVAARLAAPQVRPGQAVGFDLIVTGPAAIGGSIAPDLDAWLDRPGAIRARPLGSDLDPTDPPTRTFRYELRARDPGHLTLPPILVASFDPTSGRYFTLATASLALEVPAPPRFDPTTIRPPEPPIPTLAPRGWSTLAIEAGLGLVGLGAMLWLVRRRNDPVRPARWRWEARRLARLDPMAAGWADQAAARFERLLAAALRRPLAALTPPEASSGVRELTGDRVLADRAGRLVMALDRLRFGPEAGEADLNGRAACRAELVDLLGAVGARLKRPQGGSGRFGEKADGSLA